MFTTTPAPHRQLIWSTVLLCAALAAPTWLSTHAHAQTSAPAATGSTLAIHQPLPALKLTDQHDQRWQVPAHTRLVLFAAGRKASNLVQAVLEKEPADFLAQHHTVYLADMSKMPRVATRLFALPSLRSMPFTVGVSLNEATLAAWPRQPDSVTLISLANGVVQGVAYATTEADVREALTR